MKYILLTSLMFTTNIFAKEIVCLPVKLNAPFEQVILKKEGRGNKYSMKVVQLDQTVATDNVSYQFIRRGQISVFRNKDRSVEIKTLRLQTNRVLRSSIKISNLFSGTLSGVCKLYPEK